MSVTSFEDLVAWQRARALVRLIYPLTQTAPILHDFAMRDQLRRAALSIMTNVAEGFGRRSHADFARFLDIARASASETDCLLIACLDIGYLEAAALAPLRKSVDETTRVIAGLQSHLRSRTGEAILDYTQG